MKATWIWNLLAAGFLFDCIPGRVSSHWVAYLVVDVDDAQREALLSFHDALVWLYHVAEGRRGLDLERDVAVRMVVAHREGGADLGVLAGVRPEHDAVAVLGLVGVEHHSVRQFARRRCHVCQA